MEAQTVVRKIISGGQTGADQAALDVAMDFGISYGGWVPRGRKTENGPLDPKYVHMKESTSGRYADRTLGNVVEADGTLIVTHGPLTGGSRLTAVFAREHGKPCLHIDLTMSFRFKAAETIRSWISEQRIQVLNVAGPRASMDPEIYRATYDILQTALFMDMALSNMQGRPFPSVSMGIQGPGSLSEAVKVLIESMTLREKTRIARAGRQDLGAVLSTLAPLMKQKGVWPEDNPELMAACVMAGSQESPILPEQAPLALVVAVWSELKTTHLLRRIK
jgi:hypothetical protein